jgi:uncharacterized protein YllA (UPF0747 family)
MRPLYQESVLPNLAYFGGGGEIAYWLQLKNLFTAVKLQFPLLRVRDSYLLLSNKQVGILDGLEISILDLKKELGDLTRVHVKANSKNVDLVKEAELFSKFEQELKSKLYSGDVGLSRFVESELVKMKNQLDKIEKKIIQSEKKFLEKDIKNIEKLKNVIYPKGGFQERYENFLQYAFKDDFIEVIKKEAEVSLTNQPQIKLIKY